MTEGHREVEDTYDVADGAALPDLTGLPGLGSVQAPRTLRQVARYVDTEDLLLVGHGITLRRREGGEDDGWHLKLPVPGARHELHAPLGGSEVPEDLRRVLDGVVRDRALVEVATVETERRVASLLSADGSLLAEVCDDRVTATRPGEREPRRWREWEVEAHGAPAELLEALAARIRDAGGRPASYGSKLARTLEVRPPSRRPLPGADASERDLLSWRLEELRDDVHRYDPLTRADLPDAVHQLRLAVRRTRALLTTFASAFDGSVTEPVVTDLRWIGEILGRSRDLEVLRSRLGALALSVPPRLVRGEPAMDVDGALAAEREAARAEVLLAMSSPRYLALVDTLDSWDTRPPWGGGPDRPVAERLAPALPREWRRLDTAVADVGEADEDDRPGLLHRVRKRAKRVRYAAETLRPVLGDDAGRAAKAASRIQRVLGSHHDAVVAEACVLDLAGTAYAAGGDTFTLGVLRGDRAEHEESFRRAWRKGRRQAPRTR